MVELYHVGEPTPGEGVSGGVSFRSKLDKCSQKTTLFPGVCENDYSKIRHELKTFVYIIPNDFYVYRGGGTDNNSSVLTFSYSGIRNYFGVLSHTLYHSTAGQK